MQDVLFILIGGIGLFLLGMGMMTQGMRIAAGKGLRTILRQGTKTPFRGLLSGFAITALVQSSSAVTVATIGFVNAGILSLKRTLGIIYGSNIGTTVTAWIVAAVGFSVNIKALALPLVGFGMLLKTLRPNSRQGAFGEALAGFGIFFLGISVLKGGFHDLGSTIPLDLAGSQGFLAQLFFLALGFVLTLLMQSSSAAIAIVLTAASQGMIPVLTAAAAVIGTNVGTTSTAALSVIGATPNAKRVAAAHVIFNIMTGIVAFILLPWMVLGIENLQIYFFNKPQISLTLAVFHTLFNILGVILIWPFTDNLAKYIKKMFRTVEEDKGNPQYLDKNIINTPVLAINALALELTRMGQLTRKMTQNLIRQLKKPASQKTNLYVQKATIDRLATKTIKFINLLQHKNLSIQITEQISVYLRLCQYFIRIAELAYEVEKEFTEIENIIPDNIQKIVEDLNMQILVLLDSLNPCYQDYSAIQIKGHLKDIILSYHIVKESILNESASTNISIQDMSKLLEGISLLRRLLEQMVRGMNYLHQTKEQLSIACPDNL